MLLFCLVETIDECLFCVNTHFIALTRISESVVNVKPIQGIIAANCVFISNILILTYVNNTAHLVLVVEATKTTAIG